MPNAHRCRHARQNRRQQHFTGSDFTGEHGKASGIRYRPRVKLRLAPATRAAMERYALDADGYRYGRPALWLLPAVFAANRDRDCHGRSVPGTETDSTTVTSHAASSLTLVQSGLKNT